MSSISWPLLIALGALIAAAIVSAVILMRRRNDDHASDAADIPPLLFPAAPASQRRQAQPARARPTPAAVAPSPPVAEPPPRKPNGKAAPSVPAQEATPPADMPLPGNWVEGKTIRFHRPLEGTLQIMPGRLDIVAGADKGESIRFVRTGDPAQITFGRSDGPAYQHIQLRAPTVSRKHALMTYDNSRWSIRNLSGTNPVVLNGEELRIDSSERPLKDGDRIEMGEITFVFRER